MAPTVYRTEEWIEKNRNSFVPPICNKLMYRDGQIQAFFVGGPNTRNDFHLEAGEEFFYQMKGEMNLIVMEQGKLRDLYIQEGEVFLLPRHTAHSPQRFAETLGLVIERRRLPSELDCMRYFVEGTTTTLYERWFHLNSLDSQLPPLIKEFQQSEQYRTGKPIPGTITDNPPITPHNRLLSPPFSLKEWTERHLAEINSKGYKALFDSSYQARVKVIGSTNYKGESYLPETFLMQLEGQSVLNVEGQDYSLEKNCTALIPEKENWSLKNDEGGLTLSVVMDPITQ